ncbi:MAG: DUF4416 family protein [Phycisphaerae bacterium]|nr:DUF4416 family protein [Phycisphaerae bacterium]
MAAITQPDKVKLICGMISASESLLAEAQERLAAAYGPADIVSETWQFDFTDYYEEQMGANLLRRFVAFEWLIDPGELADIKRATNALEDEFAAAGGGDVSRPINLDPGYIAPSKLILASMKDFSHRIYLGGGVYAEITLMWRSGWQSLAWTFPDYGSGRYDEFLTDARTRLGEQIKEERIS